MLGSTPGGRGQLLVNDGWSIAGRGDLAAAEELFLEAVEASPDLSAAWDGLIRLRIQTERFEDASRTLDQARGAGLDLRSADIYEGFLAVRHGDLARARRVLDRIPGEYAPPDPYLAQLLDSSRRMLGMETRR
jgi:tetratricopeptide (TPR) repeat protein